MNGQDIDQQTAFAVGHISCWLGTYAESCSVLRSQLTLRVASILLAEADGTLLRPEDIMPSLPRRATKTRKALEPMALANGTHPDTPPHHTVRKQKKTRKGWKMPQAQKDHLSHLAKLRWGSMSKNKKTRLQNKMSKARLGK
jgi:hypothetical protein